MVDAQKFSDAFPEGKPPGVELWVTLEGKPVTGVAAALRRLAADIDAGEIQPTGLLIEDGKATLTFRGVPTERP